MKTKQLTQELRKELECLFAWSQFYAENQQWDSFEKAQRQIEAFKDKYEID